MDLGMPLVMAAMAMGVKATVAVAVVVVTEVEEATVERQEKLVVGEIVAVVEAWMMTSLASAAGSTASLRSRAVQQP